jgi:hypothetical protein
MSEVQIPDFLEKSGISPSLWRSHRYYKPPKSALFTLGEFDHFDFWVLNCLPVIPRFDDANEGLQVKISVIPAEADTGTDKS